VPQNSRVPGEAATYREVNTTKDNSIATSSIPMIYERAALIEYLFPA
jgi:hypothetical protein